MEARKTDAQVRLAFRAGVAFLLFTELLALTGIAPAPHRFLTLDPNSHSPFFAYAVAGIFAIHAIVYGRQAHVVAAFTIGMILAGLHAALFFGAHRHWLLVMSTTSYYLGIGSCLMLMWLGWRHRGRTQGQAFIATLQTAALLPLFVNVSWFYLEASSILRPVTFDTTLYHFDASLGFQASALLGQMFERSLFLQLAGHFVYVALPLFAALLYGLQCRRDDSSVNVLKVFLLVALIGYAIYFLYPVAGPLFLLGDLYPNHLPALENIPLQPMWIPPAYRNAMPSLHMAWALVLWFNARSLSALGRVGFALIVWITALATLGRGEHYLIDLVVAFPLALTAQAIGMPGWPPSVRRAMGTGIALLLGWLIYLSVGARFFAVMGVLHALPMVITLGLTLRLAKNMTAASAQHRGASACSLPSHAVVIGGMFFASGMAALIYEVVFCKMLALSFGSMAIATHTVLATYMGGIAIGAWLGGSLAQRRTDALNLYGWCELGIAGVCALLPLLFAPLRDLYAGLAGQLQADAASLTLIRVALGACVLLPPTILMGMTLPILVKAFGKDKPLGRTVGLLYAANTLGAGLGALLAGYAIIPGLGILRTIGLAVAINATVGLIALRLQAKFDSGADSSMIDAAPDKASIVSTRQKKLSGLFAFIVLGLGGFLTLALEVDYMHLLAVVAGNSTYAFSLMLFAFLMGLGAGANTGRLLLRRGISTLAALASAEFCLAAVILLGIFIWDGLPDYFASFAANAMTRTFAAREVVRGLVCLFAMLPPAFCIGLLYPLAMDTIARTCPGQRIRALGNAAAVNTIGNILGVLVTGFVLLPGIGALVTLKVLAVLAVVLGLLALPLLSTRSELRVALVFGWGAVLLFFMVPAQFDYTRLASGANVYFSAQGYGQVIAHAESVDGGLTTVSQRVDGNDGRVLTLLTNGKFQGDNDARGEIRAQAGFALAPLLHTARRDRALVIGFGTGMSARIIHEAGFRETDVVDLSADILRMSATHFRDVNNDVLTQQGVRAFATDGRNFLLLQSQQYDLISMEISSIWFAGASSLYNREFYQLAKKHLNAEGVLQQWVQLHRITRNDIATVLATVRSEFRYVRLYLIGAQGVIVATSHDAQPTSGNIELLAQRPALQPVLKVFGQSVASLLQDQVLAPADTDRLIENFSASGQAMISTDDNLILEYSTPRGNVRDYTSTLRENTGWLRSYSNGGAGSD